MSALLWLRLRRARIQPRPEPARSQNAAVDTGNGRAQGTRININANPFSLTGINRSNMNTTLSKLLSVLYTLALGAVLVPAAQTNSISTNPNPARLVWIRPGTFTMGSPANE